MYQDYLSCQIEIKITFNHKSDTDLNGIEKKTKKTFLESKGRSIAFILVVGLLFIMVARKSRIVIAAGN